MTFDLWVYQPGGLKMSINGSKRSNRWIGEEDVVDIMVALVVVGGTRDSAGQ